MVVSRFYARFAPLFANGAGFSGLNTTITAHQTHIGPEKAAHWLMIASDIADRAADEALIS